MNIQHFGEGEFLFVDDTFKTLFTKIFTVGYNVDHDAKGEEGSSAFQENAVSPI